MATLTYNGETYTVDHAVKGDDFIHGYDANGLKVVSFEGISDFAGFTYDGNYMLPEECLEETCNDVKVFNNVLVRSDGTTITAGDIIGASSGTSKLINVQIPGNISIDASIDGMKIRFKIPVDTDDGVMINVNGLGAIPILYADGTPLKAGMKAGAWITVMLSLDLASFILSSKGGGGGGTDRSWVGTKAHGPTFYAIMGLPTYSIKYV